jgi:NAD(P)-dependent dehydrogenase (short-subunit alcohol dehydrogenase family)
LHNKESDGKVLCVTYPFPVATDEFEDKRVLVTGGTKGMGEAIVRRFLLAGASVVTTGRSVLPAGQHPTLFVQADVSSTEDVEKVANLVQCEWGGIDILVNNVGGSRVPNDGFQALSDEDWERALNANLLAAVRMNRAFVPGMIERQWGVVLHISSFQQRPSLQDASLAYTCAKGALSTYNKGLANEVGPKGVRVNMISPGYVETSGVHGMIVEMVKSQGINEEAARRELMNMSGGIPIGGSGTLEEVAELVAFLASDRGASIHGADYVIERGMLPTM